MKHPIELLQSRLDEMTQEQHRVMSTRLLENEADRYFDFQKSKEVATIGEMIKVYTDAIDKLNEPKSILTNDLKK